MKLRIISAWTWAAQRAADAVAWLWDHRPGVLFTLALAIMAYGFWLAWPPLGWIALGGTVCIPMLVQRMRAV